MPKDKRIDWARIRADYIAGGISQRKLAEKYGVSETTVMKKAASEGWTDLREATYRKTIERTQQKTADAAASNAVKLEQAKGLLIDRLKAAIDSMPEDCGTHTRVYVDKEKTVEYDLLDLVTALERLAKVGNIGTDSETLKTAKELLEGIPSAID